MCSRNSRTRFSASSGIWCFANGREVFDLGEEGEVVQLQYPGCSSQIFNSWFSASGSMKKPDSMLNSTGRSL